MSDLEHALLLLKMARKDLKALKGMKDPEIFEDEVFGFHAQQAAEKAIKGWLSFIHVDYPRSHDIEALLTLLKERGASVPERFYRLIDMNDFAVQYRYESFEELSGDLDREAVVQEITHLIEHIEKLVDAKRAK